MGALGFKGNPQGLFVVGFSIAVAVLDTLAVALRFLARHRSKASFAADDWWILGSLIPLYLMIGAGGAVTAVGGLGRSIHDLSPQDISTFLKIMMCSMLTYSLTITCVKISLLVLYRRIFQTPAFRTRSLVVGVACLVWWVIEVFTNIFQCRPFTAAFDPASLFTDRCNDLQSYYTGITASNLGLDIILLLLPMHMVWKLQLPIKQRLALIGIFSLGFLSCIAGAIRIVYLSDLQKVDLTKSLANEYLWSQIEPATAIICACAVTYRPLFRNKSPSIPKKFSSIFSFGRRGGSSGSHDDAESQRRLQYEWPAGHGLAMPMIYQDMYAEVTERGVDTLDTRQDTFGTRTTCEAATPYIALSPLRPGQSHVRMEEV